jgi:hypothetical protein
MKTINFKKAFKSAPILGLFFLMTIGVTIQSCADLDPDPLEFNLPPESFSDLGAMDRGIIGVYRAVTQAARMTTFYAPAWGGDDMTTHRALNKADFREFDQRAVLSSNNRLLTNWNDIYSALATINGVLERSEGLIDSPAVDQTLLLQYRGEAYFLRGILFYQLARVHGRIPLALSQFPPADISLSSLEDVYGQIEADLLEAELTLPAKYPGVLDGAPRPNSGSARALLARLYMDWGGFPIKDTSKYALAASSAKQVMDNAGSHGFGLLDNVADLWKVENRFNQESLFTLVFSTTTTGAPNNSIANRKYSRLGLPADLGGWNETFAEIKFFQDFPEGPRKEATYRTDLDYTAFNAQKSPVFAKVTGPIGDLNAGSFETERNDFFMRYASILLIYAEASGLSENVTLEAWEALNKIRRRAAGLPYGTPAAGVDVASGNIADLAFEERKWEFAGEYVRWFDLVRREKVQEALSVRDIPTAPIPEHNPIIGSLATTNYLAPIPADAVAKNPNLGN